MRQGDARFFQSRELRSLARLIVLGLLLVALIPFARNPDTWKFFARDDEEPTMVAGDLEKKDKADRAAPTKKEPEAPAEPGPTDLDPQERSAAIEEFQAVSDRTLELQPEEMGIYWRMFNWTEHQSFAELERRAKKALTERQREGVTLNDFMQQPDVWRGEIVRLDLHVRRVLSYPAPKNSVGVKRVYELWGWTDESKAWPYCIVTADLPAEMPVGANVGEDVKVAGYFLKVLSYHEAGAAPNAKALPAPLLVGRLDWKPSAARTAKKTDWTWLWWIGGLGIIYLGLRLMLPIIFRGRKAASEKGKVGWLKDDDDRGKLAGWLSDAQAGRLAEGPPASAPNASMNGHAAGHAASIKGNGKHTSEGSSHGD
jgi:hypothetical protein